MIAAYNEAGVIGRVVSDVRRRGFRVVLKGFGVTHHTWPAAGDSVAAGATVTLFGSRPSP